MTIDTIIWETPITQTFALLAIIQDYNSFDKKGKHKPILDHIEKEVTKRLLEKIQEK